jgi:hypothetical protein
VFGPNVHEIRKIHQNPVGTDIVPVALHSIQLTEALLRTAAGTDLIQLRTVQTDAPPLVSSRVRRRPESKPAQDSPEPSPDTDGGSGGEAPGDHSGGEPEAPVTGSATQSDSPSPEPPADAEQSEATGAELKVSDDGRRPASAGSYVPTAFEAPVLGWDAATEDMVLWHPAGAGQDLNNGHVEVWGSSGMGKTQFVMSLLAQLSRHSGSKFGIADFKNDYSGDTGFPAFADAEFLDLWTTGAPYNPLALADDSERAIAAAVIELRDTVEEATRAFTKMGIRQKAKLEKALREAYAIGRDEGRWPTLRTLDDQLDDDLAGVMGDLTRHQLFKSGQPLGDVINHNVVFGLSKIPGNGQTTVAANAQTKICFGLPDATVAAMAARKLDPGNPRLPEHIRTLGVGEAYVSLRGEAPRLLRMAQAHRDAEALGLQPLRHPE